MLLPSNASDPAAMMAQALSIYKGIVGVDGVSTRMSPDSTPGPKGMKAGPWKPSQLESEKENAGREAIRASSDRTLEPMGVNSFTLQSPS